MAGLLGGGFPPETTTITPGTSSVDLSGRAFLSGSSVAGDADLASSNITDGVTIFGVTGNSNFIQHDVLMEQASEVSTTSTSYTTLKTASNGWSSLDQLAMVVQGEFRNTNNDWTKCRIVDSGNNEDTANAAWDGTSYEWGVSDRSGSLLAGTLGSSWYLQWKVDSGTGYGRNIKGGIYHPSR